MRLRSCVLLRTGLDAALDYAPAPTQVPVGSRLVRADRIYFRLSENLAPFVFEVPRCFGSYEELLKQLGTKETASAHDLIKLVHELRAECGTASLNPNEMSAVVKILRLVAATDAVPADILVPDQHSMLVQSCRHEMRQCRRFQLRTCRVPVESFFVQLSCVPGAM